MNHLDYRLPTTRLIYKLTLSLTLFGLLSFSPLLSAQASGPMVVNSTADSIADDGFCTLPEAIIAANDDVSSGESSGECIPEDGDDTIQFSVTGNIDLSDALPEITSNLAIEGPGATDLTIRRYNETDFRLFTIAAETEVTIAGLTLADGNVPSEGGGAISNSGELIIRESVFEDNFATAGGAIFNGGSLTVDQTTFRENGGHSGGAIYSTGTTEINNSTFSGNEATANDGGAIFAGGGTVTISNSTVSGNSAVQYGGGLVTSAGTPSTVNVFNSTFYGNSAGYSGGSFRKFQGTISLKNTIVAASPSGGNCSGSLTSLGYNLSSDNSCGFSASGDQQNVNPLLGELADNGGFSQTHALLAESPAIDAGDPAFTSPPDYDQRGSGFPRIVNDRVDIGAFEAEAPEATDSAQIGPTFIVNTTEDMDDGLCGTEHCSLREAVRAANAAAGPNTIILSDDTYGLDLEGADENSALTGDLDITDDLTISGVDPQTTIVDADELDRVFDIRSEVAAVTFSNITIQGGDVYGDGGGIRNAQADLVLEDVIVTDNSSSGGGSAIFDSEGSLTLTSQGNLGQIDDVVWSENGLTKTGPGKYTLTGNNSYQGLTYINEGVLSITHAQALGPQTPDPANGTVVADGATLILDVETSGAQFQEPLTLSGTGFDGGGALQFLNGIAVSEEIVLASDSSIGQYDQSVSANIGAEISGPGSLTKVGPGGLHLSYAATYNGATIIEAGFISVGLAGGVIPDSSAVTIAEGASLNLFDNDETIASLAGAGNVYLGSGRLTTGNADSTTFSGVISGSGGLTKVGSGAFTLSGVNTYQGLTSVSEGSLFVEGVVAGDVIVDYSTLGGSGTILGAVSATGNGVVAPGPGPAILKTGSLNFAASTTYAVEIGGETPGEAGYDQLEVSGTVSLDPAEPGVSLSLEFVNEFSPSAGTELVIINNDGSDAVNGTFAELAEGTVFDSNFGGSGQSARITYLGGDGNDVAIIVGAVQTGPIFTVNTADDPGDGECTPEHCSLREAIEAANASPNEEGWDEIHFEMPGSGPHTITPDSPLPTITESLFLDGLSQAGASCIGSPLLQIELDGSLAETEGTVDGLRLTAGNSMIRGLAINNFSGNGLTLSGYGSNYVECNLIGLDVDGQTAQGNGENGIEIAAPYNTIGGSGPGTGNVIAFNGLAGVLVTADQNNNTIRGNNIFGNGQLGIDLGGDGVTGNDVDDIDTGSNDLQNFPFMFQATPTNANELTIGGRLNSTADTTYALEFFANSTCNLATLSGERFVGSAQVTINADTNNVYFSETVITDDPVPIGSFVTATATNLDTGNTSEFSPCVAVSLANDIWPRALNLDVRGNSPLAVPIDQFIDVPGRSRWYRFQIAPNSKVVVDLSNLPADYDLFLYNDIQAAYDELINPTPEDVVRLGAEFAPGAPSPGAPSPGAPSPGAPSPGAPSPGAPSKNAYAPGAPSPGAPSPGAPSPGAPSLYDYAPGAPSPGAPSPGAPSPGAPSFANAETRSFLAASVLDGPVDEVIVANTWNNARDFYVRVSGRNGAFDVTQPFHLEVALLAGSCNAVQPLPTGNVTITDGDFGTIILTDLDRMEARGVFDLNDPAQVQAMQNLRDPQGSLAALAAQVNGVTVDVNSYVAALNAQADSNPACPYAKNLVAQALKDLIDDYRNANRDGSGNETLQYIVLVGNDDIVPFFRHPDRTELGNENGYVPPVENDTASQASLRLGYILSQDGYGASSEVMISGSSLPVPDLAVGRLVETPREITTMLAAFAATNGLVSPNSALITGYDFLQDGADAVVEALATQNGISDLNTLIADQNLAPSDPGSWDAATLGNALLSRRHDLIYLAGHFSANSALAADYKTFLRTTDVTGSPVDLTNAIVYSAGCHSGYNIVNQHGVPQVTFEPDWAQAFAQKGAILIAGTGYQYGDTEFVEYSERLYLNFTRELRTGSGPVSVGQALVRAKQDYLAGTPLLRGMHEKALLEATIFGLPMMAVDMPGDPLSQPSQGPLVTASDLTAGSTTGLSFVDVPISFFGGGNPLRGLDVTNVDDGSTVTATWLQGRDGVVTNPGEPVLPRREENVTVPNTVLRGVALREINYGDSSVTPLVGRPATELAPVLTGFTSDIFLPIRPWNVNYFDAMSGGGQTKLIMTPAQHISEQPGSFTSTRRQIDEMRLRLYYSNNLDLAGVNAPSIVEVMADEDVTFTVSVVGDPGAPIEDVWVTYTATSGPFFGRWRSLDLSQTSDARYWQGNLPLGETGTNPLDIRYIVQACNGAGLCTLATNEGAYYIPGGDNFALAATALALEIPNTSGPFGTQATFSAVLTSEEGGSQPLANQLVTFVLGAQRRQAVTNSNGRVTVTLPLLGLPNTTSVRVTFGGSTDGTTRYLASFDTGSFTIVRQGTALSLDPQESSGSPTHGELMVASLTDSTGRPLAEETVFFVITGGEGSANIPVITNYLGQAPLGNLDLPAGVYQVTAYYNGAIPLSTGNVVTLTSERYEPATPVSGSLTLTATESICETILDDFNRRGKNIGRNWAGSRGVGNYRLVNGAEVEVLKGKPIYWKSPSFGPDQEACVRLTKIDPKGQYNLLLKVQNVWKRGAIAVYYEAKEHGGGVVGIKTYEKKKGWRVLETFQIVPPPPGDDDNDHNHDHHSRHHQYHHHDQQPLQLAGQTFSDGTVRVFVNGNLVGQAYAGPFFENKGGRIGLWMISPRRPHARFDDFGGR